MTNERKIKRIENEDSRLVREQYQGIHV